MAVLPSNHKAQLRIAQSSTEGQNQRESGKNDLNMGNFHLWLFFHQCIGSVFGLQQKKASVREASEERFASSLQRENLPRQKLY